MNDNLYQAVRKFSDLFVDLPDSELGRYWKWKDHDEEGIRFALFVTLQEIRQLAVTLSTFLPKPTPARRILSQYHAAYLDLQAAILGLSAEDAERIPAEGEWHVRRVYSHILGADIGFTAVVRYALEGHRAGTWKRDPMSEEKEARVTGMNEEEYKSLTNGPLDGMLVHHRKLHTEILDEFSRITEEELDLPSTFWEETRFPIRHRLHRYEAHAVQHTAQIDKTLNAIGLAPNESKRLIRRIYGALAEVEGLLIGAEKTDDTAILGTASSVEDRTMEIEAVLK